MSLFKAREWWTTWCGGTEEEFDQGSLCISNIDNSPNGFDKLVIGSLNGVLRIYIPQKEGFKADDLMLEVQMNQPILQIAAGRFVSGTDQLHLCVLHPKSLSVYSVTAMTASVDHAHHFTITQMYSHRLERSAASMTYGTFGGVKEKDFICVLSMDGALTFYEQETFSLQAFLPAFLIPGPISYVPSTDSFVVSTSGRNLESFRYNLLASHSTVNDKKTKKLVPDWSKSLGEHVFNIQVLEKMSNTIMILGERSLFKFKTSGELTIMKKLEYNPSCYYSFVKEGKEDTSNTMSLVGSHANSLLIYNEIELVWAAQLPNIPVCCRIGNFEDLSGVLVTLDEFGHLYTSYLGTDPSLFVAPQVESRMGNFEMLEKELKYLNSIIKKSETGAGRMAGLEHKESLMLRVHVPPYLDDISQFVSLSNEDENDMNIPSITVQIELECKSIQPIENITVLCAAPYPLTCAQPQIDVPVIGSSGPLVTLDVSFFTHGACFSPNLQASVTVTYTTESDAPRVLQEFFDLPLNLVMFGTQPTKNAQHKITIDTNKDPVNLGELFPEMVNNAVIPVPVLGIQYYSGPLVTILSSKNSQRYRLQCDYFGPLGPVMLQFISRLKNYFDEIKADPPVKFSFHGPLPIDTYVQTVNTHTEHRLALNKYEELLNQRACQFRVIQKRLLTRFKDKTPSPLNHLDTILDGTYKQILALGQESTNTQEALKLSTIELEGATLLLNYLIKIFVPINDEDFSVFQKILPASLPDGQVQGWEETAHENIVYILRTCLSKNSKDLKAITMGMPPLESFGETLKANLALIMDRVGRQGYAIKLNTTNSSKKNTKKLEEYENTKDFDSTVLRKRLVDGSSSQTKEIEHAMHKASISETPER